MAIDDTFYYLLEALCSCGRLVTSDKIAKFGTPLLEIPEELMSSNMHPLSSSLLHLLIDTSKEPFWNSLVKALVKVLTLESKNINGSISVSDGLKVFMKALFGKSKQIYQLFLNTGIQLDCSLNQILSVS